MNNLYRNISILTLSAFISYSCEDFKFGNSFLEKPLSNEMNIDSVFSKKVYAEQQLAQVYHTLPDYLPFNNRLQWHALESITDLGDSGKSGGTIFHKGNLSSSRAGSGVYLMSFNTEHGEFSATYGLRQANIFLENVDRVPDMTEEEKRIRKGEAKMIMAIHYVQIFRNLGGMPWIDKAYKPSDDMKMTRLTLEEMEQKICALIDEAASMLPWGVDALDDGRMTAAGALGLKSRLLTFAASPLFNNDKPYKDGEAAQKHYTWYGNYKKERWQKALDAGLAFLEANQNNGNLYQLVDNGDPRKSFCSGYFDRFNHEILISSHRYTKWDINAKAVAQIRYGVQLPTLNYVDMFPMKDGTDFDWNNPEHRAHPFFTENFEPVRDPRLYETFVVTGDKFWGRKAELYNGGRDYPAFLGGNSSSPWGSLGRTGIGPRKHTQDMKNDLTGKFYQCPLLRLPEIYLNIAEAMNELGIATQKDKFGMDAYDYVNLVRTRVDMPGLTPEKVAPGIDLREAILRERALEFGFEEVRYYDINRWMHKDYLEVPLRQLRTYPVGEKVDGHYRNFNYEILEGPIVSKRVWIEQWDNKYYLCPIPLEEINKKYGLIQNPGWE